MRKYNGGDRLSMLPDDILVNILDRLNVLDAARTSVLSRRWSHLPAMLSRLTISAQDFLPDEGMPSSTGIISDDEYVRINAAAIEATKSILARRNAGEYTIRLLCIYFYLRDDDPISIGHTVGHAMTTHKVEKVEFTVLTVKDDIDDDDLTEYGKQFMSFFDACPNAFGGLTRLHLTNLRFGESDILNVLITCERLKHLHMFDCDSGNSTTLQVEHAQLSELSIVLCRFEKVKLNWVPKLTRMAFEDWIYFQEPLSVGYVPLLEAVSLTNVALRLHKNVKLSEFLGGTSVRDLRLGFNSEKIWVQPECPTKRTASVFHQLRFVNLVDLPEGYDLSWTMFILEAAPSLKELYMTVWDHPCGTETDEEKRRAGLYSENKGVGQWVSSVSDFQHQSLATLTIIGFQSEDYLISYVRLVMATAVNLEHVFLYGRLLCDDCEKQPPKPFRFPRTKRQRCSLKKRINEGIDSFAIIRSGVKIRADHRAKMMYP